MGRNKGLVSTGKEEHVEKRRSKRKRNTTSNPYNLTPTTSAPEEKRQKKAPPKSSDAISSDSNVPSTNVNKSLGKSSPSKVTASEKQKKARAGRTKKASTASRKRSLVHRQPVKQEPECGDLKTEGIEVKGERKENIKDLLKAEVPEMQGLIKSAKYVGAHVSVAGMYSDPKKVPYWICTNFQKPDHSQDVLAFLDAQTPKNHPSRHPNYFGR